MGLKTRPTAYLKVLQQPRLIEFRVCAWFDCRVSFGSNSNQVHVDLGQGSFRRSLTFLHQELNSCLI